MRHHGRGYDAHNLRHPRNEGPLSQILQDASVGPRMERCPWLEGIRCDLVTPNWGFLGSVVDSPLGCEILSNDLAQSLVVGRQYWNQAFTRMKRGVADAAGLALICMYFAHTSCGCWVRRRVR